MHSGSRHGGDATRPPPSDEMLMARFKRGQVAAMDELVERYRMPLYSFLWRMTGNETDTQEVFQDTWVRVITKAKGFKQERFKGWLFRIAHNLVIDRVRRRHHQISLDAPVGNGDEGDQTLGDRLVAEGPEPDRSVQNRDLTGDVELALRELPREQREVFLMRMESDMTFREIAETQGVSLNTALARMQYALGKMRKLLDHHRPDWGNDHDM